MACLLRKRVGVEEKKLRFDLGKQTWWILGSLAR